AIGMISDARFDDTLESVDLALEAGDMIILYTDGYTEAMSQSHKLYGDDRLLNVVRKNIGSSAKKMLEAINSDVRTFTGATVQSDDMTMVIIRVSPDGLMG
ncbi:MAG TPA: stage II sporulation protein E, partial [Bacteroidetes bacterium]|nr:stage II sporulation protein E [Bacteroidota bacterium]